MSFESQIPIASSIVSRRFARRLALFYGSIFALVGCHLPFFPVWLRAVGIDAAWIGVIAAVPAVTRFTVLPVVTGLAERHAAVRGAMVATAIVTALDQFWAWYNPRAGPGGGTGMLRMPGHPSR